MGLASANQNVTFMSSDSSTLGKRRKHNDLKISDKVLDGAAVQCEMNKTFATTRNKLFVVPFFNLTFYTVSTFPSAQKARFTPTEDRQH